MQLCKNSNHIKEIDKEHTHIYISYFYKKMTIHILLLLLLLLLTIINWFKSIDLNDRNDKRELCRKMV